MKKIALIVFACIVLNLSGAQAGPLGDALRTKGDTAKKFEETRTLLSSGDPLFENERVLTGTNSRVEVRFEEGTMLYLGDDTDLLIEKWLYEDGQRGTALFNLTQGVFRMVSGQINKTANSSFQVRTPIATIGVRGTDFWGQQTKDSLLMALLDNGRLDIQTQTQTITLTEPLTAVLIERGKTFGEPFKLTDEQLAAAVKTIE